MHVQGCQGCEVFTDCPRHGAKALRQAEKEAYSEFLERVEFIRQAFDAIDQAGVPLQLQEKVRSVLSGWQEDTVHVAFLAFEADVQEVVDSDFDAVEHAFSVARDSLANSGE